MKAVGYCRVSTDEQADTGQSLPAQRDKFYSWCNTNDATPACDPFSDDGISGKSMSNRPGLHAAISKARELKAAGEKVVFVVYSLSRLSRSTRDTLDLSDMFQEEGIDLASLCERIDTCSPSGKMFFTIMAALNQFKIDETIEQTNAALDLKRKNGEALGNTPYGWRNSNPNRKKTDPVGMLVADDNEAAALLIMLQMQNADSNCGEIARALDAAGHKPRRGETWDRGVVRRILAFYRTQDGVRLIDRHPTFSGMHLEDLMPRIMNGHIIPPGKAATPA